MTDTVLLTLKRPGHIFQNVILFSNDIHSKRNTAVRILNLWDKFTLNDLKN